MESALPGGFGVGVGGGVVPDDVVGGGGGGRVVCDVVSVMEEDEEVRVRVETDAEEVVRVERCALVDESCRLTARLGLLTTAPALTSTLHGRGWGWWWMERRG